MTTQQKILSQFINWSTTYNTTTDQEAKGYAKELSAELYWNPNRQLVNCISCSKKMTTNPSGICDDCL